MRSWPAMVTGLPPASPLRNCRSDRVSVAIACSSVRTAICLLGECTPVGEAATDAETIEYVPVTTDSNLRSALQR